MTLLSWFRERFPAISVMVAFVASCIAASNVNGTGFCGAMVLLFDILLTILYAMCARMYKRNRSYTESYQILAQSITWSTAYQLGLMCADMTWPIVLACLAYAMFVSEWRERTITSFQIQSSSIDIEGTS